MRTVVLLIACCFTVNAWTQSPPLSMYILPEGLNAEYQRAEQLLLQKQYAKALKGFEKIAKKKPEFIPALRGIGACQALLLNYDEASLAYNKALGLNPRFSRALYFETADALFKSGNYYMALELFMEFDTLRTVPNTDFSYNGVAELATESEYYQVLSRSIRGCRVAMDSIQFHNISAVTNLGPSINTEGDEYFPFLSNDQKTIFFTRRKDQFSDENLFVSNRSTDKWRIANAASKDFNTDFNEGMTTFVRDGRQMFFTACERTGILGTCDVWKAKMEGEKVVETGPVIGYINSGDWDSQASINCDGTVLFFASNREGGFGGTDIWMCERQLDGRWGKPQNLGDKVNTEGDEEAPFITNDGMTLYFSSTGHLGLGEQDIFMTKWDDLEGWGDPINLGIPINSSYRELGFFLSADGKTGMVSSNRKGGHGGMDIYEFALSEQLFSNPITYVEGVVMDSILKTPIQTTVKFKNRPQIETDENGRFFLCIDAFDKLSYTVNAEDYHPHRSEHTVPQWDNKTFYPLHIYLDPLFRLPVFQGELEKETDVAVNAAPSFKKQSWKTLRHEVFFDFDKALLKAEMKESINGFLNDVFDGSKTVINVSVVGFSDDIGTDAYNMMLSEKRAKEVGVFLKEKGIRVDKIFIEGRGETRNNKPKKENRKVELVISVE